MTDPISSPAPAAAPSPNRQAPRRQRARHQAATPARAPSHPVLVQLAQWYPALFGETCQPLKRGIYQDLMEAHPDALDKEALKAALALHTRSTRYLRAVSEGQRRHDLMGQSVEDMAPEHVHHALLEVFRRRHARTGEDVRLALRDRMVRAIQASGLGPEAYASLVKGRDEEANALLDDAITLLAAQTARGEALLRAFEASGQTVEAFAGMYGLETAEAEQTLAQARHQRTLAGH